MWPRRREDADALPRPAWWLRAAPGAVIAAVMVTDWWLGPEQTVLGLVVTAPLLASAVVGPYLTAVYGVLALAAAVVMGFWDHQYTAQSWSAQAVRLVVIALAVLAGVAAADYRLGRESRLRQVTRVAEAAQRAILIPVPNRLDPVHLAVGYESAASEALIGGDVYGVVTVPGRLRILVADVRGKGLEAVRLSAQVLAAFRERAWDHESLPGVLADLDRAVRRAATAEDFVTAVLAELTDDGALRLALAGHPAPLLIRAGAVVQLPAAGTGTPLGLDGAVPQTVALQLDKGDRLLLFTDGLTEARRPDGTYFPETGVVTAVARGPLDACLRDLTVAVRDWTGDGLQDDVALLLLEYDPGEVSPKPADLP
jgi:serine phosphatase RsbU (regulator of sigma subunit)